MTTQNETAAGRVAAALEMLNVTGRRTRQAAERATEVKTAPVVDEKNDIVNNQVYRIWNDGHLSNAQKVDATVSYLTCVDGNYAQARARFLEYKAFFAAAQQAGVEVDIRSMEALIEEVKNATKPMVDGIVNGLNDVNQSVEVTSKLLSVIRKARLDGKTIEAIGEAFRHNEKVIAYLADRERAKVAAEAQKRNAEGLLKDALADDAESRKGLVKGLMRSLTGPDKQIAARIETAQGYKDRAEAEIRSLAALIGQAEAQRRQDMEDGPLSILRTLDATTDNFSDNLVKQAERGIKLLRGVSASIGALTSRTDTGEIDIRALLKKTSDAAARDELLQGVLKKVAEVTHAQAAGYTEALAAKDAQIDAETDETQLALLKSERSLDVEKRDSALDYEETLLGSVNAFASIMSNGVDARGRAQQDLTFIQAQKALFERLANEALPATSTALYTVLTEARALQIGEEGMAVSAVTEKARQLGQSGLAGVLQTQRDMHKASVEHATATIKALEEAHTAIADQIVRAVEEGVENRKLGDRLQQVAGELRDSTETFAQVRASVADMSGKGDAANQNGVGGEEEAPARPAGGGSVPGVLRYPQVA